MLRSSCLTHIITRIVSHFKVANEKKKETATELHAAFARIASVPADRTLLDEIDSEHWNDSVDGSIEVGAMTHEDHDLDMADAPVKK